MGRDGVAARLFFFSHLPSAILLCAIAKSSAMERLPIARCIANLPILSPSRSRHFSLGHYTGAFPVVVSKDAAGSGGMG